MNLIVWCAGVQRTVHNSWERTNEAGLRQRDLIGWVEHAYLLGTVMECLQKSHLVRPLRRSSFYTILSRLTTSVMTALSRTKKPKGDLFKDTLKLYDQTEFHKPTKRHG